MTTIAERDRLMAIAKHEAVFADPGRSVGRWITSEPDTNGVLQVPWFEYGPEAEAFRNDAVTHGWVIQFDWMAWVGSPEARRLIEDPGLVAQASADDLAKLLTAIIRGERFSEGQLAGAYESGMLLAITRRARELAATA